MKKIAEKVVGILLVLALIGYFVALYPLKVSTDEYGEAKCESLIGLSVGC